MSDERSLTEGDVENNEVWPRKLNKALIGIGVIAFGLIIADRLINTFREGGLGETVAMQSSTESSASTESLQGIHSDDSNATDTTIDTTFSDEILKMEDVFGSRLVFVSTSEPLYVVTDDDRRFDVGGDIDDDTTLAGITSQRLILDKSGDLKVVRLHEPQSAE